MTKRKSKSGASGNNSGGCTNALGLPTNYGTTSLLPGDARRLSADSRRLSTDVRRSSGPSVDARRPSFVSNCGGGLLTAPDIAANRSPSPHRRISHIPSMDAWQPSPGDRPMYDGADMPACDLPEDHLGPEPLPVPLDISRLGKIGGYEDVGYHSHQDEDWSESAPPIPPPKTHGTPVHVEHEDVEQTRPEEQFISVPHISEDSAREALIHHVAEHCCFGKRAALDMSIYKITPSSALHYTLETYTEVRCTSWEQEPYNGTDTAGQTIDGPHHGTAPLPWDIHSNPTQTFHNETHCFEVPHTATVMPCHGCQALGWIRCHSCLGRGFKQCMYCHGNGRLWKTDAHGHRHIESCWHCHGTGRKRCLACSGDGRITCKTCKGFRQLKCYIKLIVTYTNHIVEHITEHTDMPAELVKGVSGEQVFEQTQPKVWPIANYPDHEVCVASQRLINDQLNMYTSARILMQRHRLRAVPVSECAYSFKDSDYRYWVYGKENRVHAPDYPQKCCWGCVIL